MDKKDEQKIYEAASEIQQASEEGSLVKDRENVGVEKEPKLSPNEPSSTRIPETQKGVDAPNLTNVADSLQEIPPVPPDTSPRQEETLTVKPKRSFNAFRIFITLAIIAIIVIYSFVLYLYLQNKKMIEKSQQIVQTIQTPTPIPTPSFSPDWIKIQNGNVVRQEPGKEPTLLVKKEDYPSTGITGFARVVVSPNYKLICFESWPPAVKPALYLADIDGNNVKEISLNKQNCVFREDSKAIFYVESTPKSESANIFLYDLETDTPQEENLTQSSIPEKVVRRFAIVGFSSDSTKLICKYEEISNNKEEKSGECEIDLQKKEVKLL